MKTILLALSLLFIDLHLYSQSTGHPTLTPIHRVYTETNVATGSSRAGTKLKGYKYGDRVIPATRKGKKEVIEILKLEPLAYQQHKRAKLTGSLALPMIIGGVTTGIFGFRYMFSDTNPTKVPVIVGGTLLLGGIVLYQVSGSLSDKCFRTFNANATSASGNVKDKKFRLMFGMNYNPMMRKAYPAVALKF